MTLKPLDFDFPLMSDMSRRPPHAVPLEEMLLELEAEIAHRETFYGRMIAQGKMQAHEANRHKLILRAIRADLGGRWERSIDWDTKVRELRRELALRRNMWPRKIARPADPMGLATARPRMERMEAVHFAYWIKLDFFDAGRDAVRVQGERVREWEMAQHAAGNPAAREYLIPKQAGKVAA